jgi:hypothetical protein
VDVQDVQVNAKAFARILAERGDEVVSSHLSPDRAENITKVLHAVPRPIEATELVMVTPLSIGRPDDESTEEFVSLPNFGVLGETVAELYVDCGGCSLAHPVSRDRLATEPPSPAEHETYGSPSPYADGVYQPEVAFRPLARDRYGPGSAGIV